MPTYGNYQLHYDFVLEKQQSPVLKTKNFSTQQIDRYLNRAQRFMVENLAAKSQETRQVIEDLRILYKDDQSGKILKRGSNYVLIEYPSDILRMMSVTLIASIKGCNEKRRIAVSTEQSEKFDNLLKSRTHRPSWGWAETIGRDTSEGYKAYTDGVFKVEEVYLNYYRHPRTIYYPEGAKGVVYRDESGKVIEKNSEIELTNANQPSRIVSLAVAMAARDEGSLNEFQARASALGLQESVYS